MIRTDELELLQRLADGDVEHLQAAIDQDEGRIVYPAAERLLERDAVVTVTRLAEEGVLEPTVTRDVTCVLSDPHETVEMQLSRYVLSDAGHEWLNAHVGARRAAADLLESRGFTVDVDTTVTGESGIEHPVHLHAVDDLVGIELAVGITETAVAQDVVDMMGLAADTGADPVLVTTSDPTDTVREFADRRGVSVLKVDGGSPEATDADA
jgi:hypothetical protein